MAILFDRNTETFHLKTSGTSYIMQIIKGQVAHHYWGKRLETYNGSNKVRITGRPFTSNPDLSDRAFSLDTLPREYPSYGSTDFHMPAFHIQWANGTTIVNLEYAGHRILKGKPELEGLPATYAEREDEADTLEIDLVDKPTGLKVVLSYTIFEALDAIARHARFENGGGEPLSLLRALSMNVDFRHRDFDWLHLPGAWARERAVERKPLVNGSQSADSTRGASSHQQNPFIALLDKDATEDNGEVYGFNLVYSGNFTAGIEVDQFQMTRVALGINPFDFSWRLEPGETFQTPEAVLVYSDKGIGGMSRTYHRLYRKRLCREAFRDKTRPVLINNWEATYFDFDHEKIVGITAQSKDLGIELFVLDDGWFGRRNDDTTSLGDWTADRKKLPDGIEALAGDIEKLGLKFGLWFEPEMVSRDSDLYRKHPDWCLHVPNRSRSEGRNQLVLDLSRADVQDYIIEAVSNVLAAAPISYVKWDMNRHMTEVGSALLPAERQRETAHRYMLGLYRVLDAVTGRFPAILFESCSGGGGRFDPGMLYYMPQTWTSDNTDAVSRLEIQYGTSLVYPPLSMGAHVSAVPNHQVHRTTSLKMRGDVAMAGTFGYELDVSLMSAEEKEEVKAQVAFYKSIRHLLVNGDFYRLMSPFGANHAAWMFVSEDKQEALAFYYQKLARPNAPGQILKLKGLLAEGIYGLEGSEEAFSGGELMHAGIHIPMPAGDFSSTVWHLRLRP